MMTFAQGLAPLLMTKEERMARLTPKQKETLLLIDGLMHSLGIKD